MPRYELHRQPSQLRVVSQTGEGSKGNHGAELAQINRLPLLPHVAPAGVDGAPAGVGAAPASAGGSLCKRKLGVVLLQLMSRHWWVR